MWEAVAILAPREVRGWAGGCQRQGVGGFPSSAKKRGAERGATMIRDLLAGIGQLLFPPSCPVCRQRLAPDASPRLCQTCRGAVVHLRPPLCLVCGRELVGDPWRAGRCGDCLRRPPPYSLARSLLRYEPCVGLLLQRLKYHGDTSVLTAIADLVVALDLSAFEDCRMIVPVPLHLGRHRQRGLNQAMLLARLFFPQRPDDIVGTVLQRTRYTQPQTQLSGAERRSNLAGAFAVSSQTALSGRICLVDDVFTTGSTVSECAKTLLRHGAEEVRVLTLARADRSR